MLKESERKQQERDSCHCVTAAQRAHPIVQKIPFSVMKVRSSWDLMRNSLVVKPRRTSYFQRAASNKQQPTRNTLSPLDTYPFCAQVGEGVAE